MLKILFICHGNICRSPIAEFIMKELIRKNGLTHRFEVASAAVSAEEGRSPLYPPAERILKKHGIPCGGHHAHRITAAEYEEYDMIIAMDRSNLRYLDRITKNDPKKKITLLMTYAGKHRDVADPWYTDDFDTAYEDIYEGCSALLDSLEKR